MRLIGLPLLQGFGADHAGAVQPLAALAATIRAPDIRNSAMLETQLGAMIAGKDRDALHVDLTDVGCRVTIRVNDRLQTAQIVAVT
ncbi:hypothetical protein AB4144_32375, partial [Rhizobiaceae sp. 2RAB30]